MAPGQCDGVELAQCRDWAARVGASWDDATALCDGIYDPNEGATFYYCLRADHGGLGHAQCGDARSCEVGEVCARRAADQPFECLPCTAD